ncbi:MAG: quinone-dependent dihydroorotate dehydrogenase [Anaerolineales bacterium]
MYPLFRPFLFRLDPETAHHLTLQLIRLAGILPPARWGLQAMFRAPEKPVEVFGLKFKNPVGLAAGYDKDGVAVRGLATLGFGHLEIGTVTPRPQPGNPRPRVFRLVEDEAVINRMGFPGAGAWQVEHHLSSIAHRPQSTVIGVNLGKNKDTPLEEAAKDYVALLEPFSALADYLAINISSPNTVGLRRLQGRDMLEALLGSIALERQAIVTRGGRHAPILVKLAPDLSEVELEDALDVILRTNMDGIIATNTTLERAGLRSRQQGETGGLSGGPLRLRSKTVLAQVLKRLDGRLPVISAGGIMSPEEAIRRLDMGAALVQVYTGLVYAGPELVQKIIRAV